MKLSNIQSAMNWSLTSIALVGIITIANPVLGQKGKKKDNKESENNDVNLVNNGSFENHSDKKPKKLGGINTMTGWFSPTGVKADTYRDDTNTPADTKGRPLIGAPISAFGQEDAYEGKCYVGISTYLTGKKQNERSYLKGLLESPLSKNKTYCIEFWVSLAEGSKFATNNIGVKFIRKGKDIEKDEKQILIGQNIGISQTDFDVLHPENKVFNSANGWYKVCGTYVAKGGEESFIIGNFMPNSKTTAEPFKQSKQSKATAIQAAYYYIDNVIVRDYYDSFDSYLASINPGEVSEEQLQTYEKNFETLGKCECFTKAVIDTDTTYSKLTYQKDFIIEDRMKSEEKIQTYQVYFAAGSSKLSSEANTTLDEIAKILNANSTFKLKVVGHADTVEFNLSTTKKPEYADVDKKRAEAVKEKLTALGVKNVITTDSKAAKMESDSVSGDVDEKELDWAKNRRVEFFIEK
jgi:outer membrane protein OmpA-like peptidoglycan-associated protein